MLIYAIFLLSYPRAGLSLPDSQQPTNMVFKQYTNGAWLVMAWRLVKYIYQADYSHCNSVTKKNIVMKNMEKLGKKENRLAGLVGRGQGGIKICRQPPVRKIYFTHLGLLWCVVIGQRAKQVFPSLLAHALAKFEKPPTPKPKKMSKKIDTSN